MHIGRKCKGEEKQGRGPGSWEQEAVEAGDEEAIIWLQTVKSCKHITAEQQKEHAASAKEALVRCIQVAHDLYRVWEANMQWR